MIPTELGHPPVDLLIAFAGGHASDVEVEALGRHLEECESCCRLVEQAQADNLEERLRQAVRHSPDEDRRGAVDALGVVSRLVAMGEPSSEDDDPIDLRFLAPPQEPGEVGRLGHYAVLEPIGHGGMGIVLKARDDTLQRIVALKVMSPHLAGSGAARRRFLREARAAAAVCHENVVTIHAVEEFDGLPGLAMQYVHGVSLQEKIDRCGPLELDRILRIGLQIAEGLCAAHKQGVVHRDIKPANILLGNGVERVTITDFGLARAGDDASITQAGVVAGTPMYMAPEQADGRPADARSDLFSLGSVLYAMCTGRPPFEAETTLGVLRRVADGTPNPVRELNPAIPVWLADVIARLHEKNPANRFQSAREVADLLAARLAALQQGLPDDSPVTRRRRWPWLVALLLLLVPLVSVGLWLTRKSSPPHVIRLTTQHGWVNALPMIDLNQDMIDVKHATWAWDNGDLVVVRDDHQGPTTQVRLPLRVYGDFEIEVEFTAIRAQIDDPSNHSLQLIVPVGDQMVAVCLAGIDLIHGDGIGGPHNPWLESPLREGKRCRLGARVFRDGDRARVEITANGQPHHLWEGPADALSDPTSRGEPQAIDLAVWPQTTIRLHHIRVRLIDGEATLSRMKDVAKDR